MGPLFALLCWAFRLIGFVSVAANGPHTILDIPIYADGRLVSIVEDVLVPDSCSENLCFRPSFLQFNCIHIRHSVEAMPVCRKDSVGPYCAVYSQQASRMLFRKIANRIYRRHSIDVSESDNIMRWRFARIFYRKPYFQRFSWRNDLVDREVSFPIYIVGRKIYICTQFSLSGVLGYIVRPASIGGSFLSGRSSLFPIRISDIHTPQLLSHFICLRLRGSGGMSNLPDSSICLFGRGLYLAGGIHRDYSAYKSGDCANAGENQYYNIANFKLPYKLLLLSFRIFISFVGWIAIIFFIDRSFGNSGLIGRLPVPWKISIPAIYGLTTLSFVAWATINFLN